MNNGKPTLYSFVSLLLYCCFLDFPDYTIGRPVVAFQLVQLLAYRYKHGINSNLPASHVRSEDLSPD